MKKPVLLWADLTINGGCADLREQFAGRCTIRSTLGDQSQPDFARRSLPDFGFLEYDYPDRRALAILQSLKRQRPSIPLIMITLTHSEELAVWAFRSGAWDYLTKPVSAAEIARICARMESLMATRDGSDPRKPTMSDCDVPTSSQYCAGGDPKTSVSPALAYMQSHYGEKITEARLAKLCGMSKFRFSRAFREQCGVTFREALLQLRIRRSAKLLENPSLTVTQVSFMAGFNDLSHFAKMFRRYYGKTASDFRVQLDRHGPTIAGTPDAPAEAPFAEAGIPLFLPKHGA